jgi:GNAT superfamily N-acetyltransferase
MTSDHIVIRPMDSEDIAAIVPWMLETPLWQRYGMTAEKATRYFDRALANGDWLYVGDIGPHKQVGFAWCVPEGGFGRSPYLRLIGVRRDRSGVGLGGALLHRVEAQAIQKSDHLLLLVSDFNETAQAFYRRLGYVQVGALPGFVLPDVAELIYYKRLKPWNS